MSVTPTSPTSAAAPNYMLRRVMQLVIFILIMGACLFIPAGTLAWPGAWLLLGLYIFVIGFNAVVFMPRRRELLEERSRIKAGAKTWDKWLVGANTVVGNIAPLLVAGFDQRLGWSPQMPGWWMVLGGLIYLGAFAFTSWAMYTNQFFSGIVRIQTERGHHVIDSGPYAWVRHPGYVGLILTMLSVPLLLSSLWAFVPVLVGVAILVTRTALEDRTLRNELPGYEEYTRRVRYRLLPGLW